MIRTTGGSLSNVFRWKRSLHSDSHVGVSATDRRLDGGGGGTTYGIDSRFRLSRNWQVEAQIMGSNYEEPNDTTLIDGSTQTLFDGGDYR